MHPAASSDISCVSRMTQAVSYKFFYSSHFIFYFYIFFIFLYIFQSIILNVTLSIDFLQYKSTTVICHVLRTSSSWLVYFPLMSAPQFSQASDVGRLLHFLTVSAACHQPQEKEYNLSKANSLAMMLLKRPR